MRQVAPAEAKALVEGGGETAFLDLREAADFGDGHPLFAIPCPFSRLELIVGALVPRTDAPVLLIDGGDGVAARGAGALRAMGYSDVAEVAGGTPGWAAAGFTLYEGVNVPSKVLGELAEAARHPRTIDAATLAGWQASGRPFHLFDCRPPAECAEMRIPGAVCLPNGELAHRFDAAVTDGAPVVLTCAGRTRGIVGALGLSLAGIGHEVLALENGTQGWALAGQALERGNAVEGFPTLDAAAQEATRARAAVLLGRDGTARIDAAGADALRQEAGRTTYLLDIRSVEETTADPLSAFTPALSGQIVQATDRWIGVRHARLVLADDLGLRAAIAAHWLRCLGHEVFVLPIDDASRALVPLPGPLHEDRVERCGANEVLADLAPGRMRLLDVRSSETFRESHVAGAIWGLRTRLDRIPMRPGTALCVLDDGDGMAALAAGDLTALGYEEVRVVAGGIAALVEAGAELESTPDDPPQAEAVDVVRFAHGRHDGDLDASRLYLSWEQGLTAQLDPGERAAFAL